MSNPRRQRATQSRTRSSRNDDRTRHPPGFAARAGAVRLLGSVLDKGQMLDEGGLKGAPAERAEARALADITLRRMGQIDAVLVRFVDHAPPGDGLNILRLMAAELLFHGTASHAAVDMGVRLAKAGRGTGRLSGLINAVGRRLVDQGAGIVAEQDAAALALPPDLATLLIEDWGAEATRAMAEAQLTPAPHDLTVTNPADTEALAEELNAIVLPTGSLRLRDRPQISALPGYAQGAWWVQDAAAALPVQMLEPKPGMRVLDLCAAPGGKTLQLAASGADVSALDISKRRLERVAQNLERTGLKAELVAADALDWTPDAPFDAILLDAPCSATGTIRRHPDLPHRGEHVNLEALADLQTALLMRAAEWLSPGGTLVYCTCSLLRAEGDARIGAACKDGLPLVPAPMAADGALPAEFISDDGYLRTRPDHWPDLGGLDGFFAARLRRA